MRRAAQCTLPVRMINGTNLRSTTAKQKWHVTTSSLRFVSIPGQASNVRTMSRWSCCDAKIRAERPSYSKDIKELKLYIRVSTARKILHCLDSLFQCQQQRSRATISLFRCARHAMPTLAKCFCAVGYIQTVQ